MKTPPVGRIYRGNVRILTLLHPITARATIGYREKVVTILDERFNQPVLPETLQWFCEPSRWELAPGGEGLVIWPDSQSDFWQRTHNNSSADNGHLLYADIEGDFAIETAVSFEGLHQYDQAGLMLRQSARSWLKCSVEFEPDSPNRLGAVVTRGGFSDWSTQDVPREQHHWYFRVTRTASDCLVEASSDGESWTQIRLAHLPAEGVIQAGIYACSPKAAGFFANFDYVVIGPAPSHV